MITCCILTLVPCFQAKRLESKWVKSGYVLDRKLALPYFYLIGDLSQSTSSQKSRKKQTVKYCFIFLKVLGISLADLVISKFECWILNIGWVFNWSKPIYFWYKKKRWPIRLFIYNFWTGQKNLKTKSNIHHSNLIITELADEILRTLKKDYLLKVVNHMMVIFLQFFTKLTWLKSVSTSCLLFIDTFCDTCQKEFPAGW